MRARAQSARRHVRETNGIEQAHESAYTAPADERQRELRTILDDELARLPGSLRSPVVLCYLEGLTHDEAAEALHWPVGTVRSRMARAQDLLRGVWRSRGVTSDTSALGVALARQPVPVTLLDSTVRASLAFATNKSAAAGVASATAATLARGVLHTMTISKFKVLGTLTLAGILALGGADRGSPVRSQDRGNAGRRGAGDQRTAIVPASIGEQNR